MIVNRVGAQNFAPLLVYLDSCNNLVDHLYSGP